MDGASDFAGEAEPAHGNFLLGEFSFGIAEGGQRASVNKTGANGIDGNADASDFLGQGLSESDHAGLGGGVIGLAGRREQSAQGGDINNAAVALGDHGPQDCLAAVKNGVEIFGEGQIPVFDGEIGEKAIAMLAGVIDQNIEGLLVSENGLDSLVPGLGRCDIEGKAGALAGEFGGQ